MALHIGDEELWDLYKKQFSKEEWPKACQDIFATIRPGHYGAYTWYAAEDRYDLIMESLEAYFHSDILKRYEKKLKALYPEKCLALLVTETEEMAERGKKRSDYRRIARNLNWICRYPGGLEKASMLADRFRVLYKYRRAMMDEIAGF